MTTSSQSTDSTTTTTTSTTGYVDPAAPAAEAAPAEPTLDAFGYEVTPKEEPAKADPEPTPEAEKRENNTGYGEEPTQEEPAKEEPAKEEPAKEEPTQEELDDAEKLRKFEIEKSLRELPEGYKAEDIAKFAEDNKLSKEQVQAYVDFAKQESEANLKAQEQMRIDTRKNWLAELKNDESFGGENFNINVQRAEQILSDFMPNTKKALTDAGSMLPPYVMRDLISLHKALNPTSKLVTGDPSTPVKEDDGNFLDDMYN